MVEGVPTDSPGLALLQHLCDRGRSELEVDAVAVSMLIGQADLTPTYATDERTQRLEQDIAVLGEGPSPDAVRFHTRVVVPDIEASEVSATWPVWTQAALGAGFCATASFPVQQGAVVAGALAVYCDTPQPFERDRRLRAFRLADAALLALLDIAAGIVRDPLTTSDPADAVAEQVVRPQVHRAAGMVMVQAGVSIDEAMVLLRTWAFRHDRRLSDVADDVVSRRIRLGSEESGPQ